MTNEEAIKSIKQSYQEAKTIWNGYGDISAMFNVKAVGILLSIISKNVSVDCADCTVLDCEHNKSEGK